MTVEQDIEELREEIKRLKRLRNTLSSVSPFGRSSALGVPSSFSRLGQISMEQGSTGSATTRRIPLYPLEASGGAAVGNIGNFDAMAHYQMIDAADAILYYNAVVSPSDLVLGPYPSIHYNYSNAGTSGDVDWVVRVVSFSNEDTAETGLLLDTTSVTVPGVADTMTERVIDFTLPPELNTSLSVSIIRNGIGDSNNSNTIIWNAWIEYVAYN